VNRQCSAAGGNSSHSINTLLKPQVSVTVTHGVSVVGAGWAVTVGVVIQPAAGTGAHLHCTQGLAGRGDRYQCGLD